MNKRLWGLCFLLISVSSFSQDSLIEKALDEIIIYSGKFATNKKNIAQNIEVFTANDIRSFNAQTTADLLTNTGNVFLQKSQQGGGSPVLRGFEASRVLLVIDGVRMNNAIYRTGHLQNIITVDQNMLQGIEVMYGPGSTIYGSDALGGVIVMRTKQPVLSSDKNFITGSSFIRYSSADNEKTGHVDLSIGNKKIAWNQSYTYSDFDHVRMGARDKKGYELFGSRNNFIAYINGIDTILNNKNNRIQKYSGYRQWDITQKVLYKQNERTTHLVNFQLSNSSNIPRYDRLQDVRNGVLRFAEWYYGPQKRVVTSYELNRKRFIFLDEIKSIISYQSIEESRHTREYKQYARFDHRKENLDVWGITIDGRKRWKRHELTTGIDGQFNNLNSTAYRENIKTGTHLKLDTRYPNGDNRMFYGGVYAQHLFKLHDNKFVINDGLRFQFTRLHSTIADNSFFNFPFTNIAQKNASLTGNLRFVYMPEVNTRLSLNFASGFRAPNIDDLSRIFESNSTAQQLIIPNPDIKPEYTYTSDIGLSKKLGKTIELEVTAFYTVFRNAITLAPFKLGEKDSVQYNGMMSRIFANQNKNKAYVTGINANTTIQFLPTLRLYSTINYTYGRFINNDKSSSPLDHIPPLYGRTSLLFTQTKWDIEGYALFNGWKHLKNYSLSGEDNLQYATSNGTPAWITYNLRSNISVTNNLQLQLGIENIFDTNYRYFSSGISAPGRNFIITARNNF